MSFCGGIKLRQFLSEYQEIHALMEGFADGFLHWRGKHEPDAERKKDIQAEHHYYNIGRVSGFACLILFLVAMIKLLF